MDKIGLIVKIYTKPGFVFTGSIIQYDDLIKIKAMNGDIIELLSKDQIVAIQYINSNEKPLKEKNIQDQTPNHSPGDINALVKVKKLKAEEELKDIRAKLSSNTNSMESTSYESQLSALLGIAKHK